MTRQLAADIFLGTTFTALGLVAFISGLVNVIRHALLKFRGRSATAALTNIYRKNFGRSERFFATAEWRDENGRQRREKIVSYGGYLMTHLNKPMASDVVYYNERHAMLAYDKRNRLNAILLVPLGLLILACGIGTLIEKTNLLDTVIGWF